MRSARPALLLLVAMIVVASLLSAAERDRTSGDRAQTTTTTALPAATPAGGDGREVVAKLPSRRPVRARVGDTVVLRVSSATPDIAKVTQLGLQTAVGPALLGELRFVADAPGEFPVVLQVAGTTGGIVRVRDAAAK